MPDIFALGSFFDSGDDAGDSAIWGDDVAGDIVGDEMAGDIVGDIVGAAPRRKVVPRGYHPRTVKYDGFKPNKVRRYSLGFSATVAAAATQPVSNQPQLPFRAERMVIPSVVGVNFALADFKIGNRSQLVADGAVPALMFSEQAVGTSLLQDTAYISQTITFLATNLTGAPKLFQAGIIGTTMDH